MLGFVILVFVDNYNALQSKGGFEMVNRIKERMSSDRAAVGTVEAVLLMALAVFAVLAVNRYILNPLSKSSEGIGLEIEAMDPRN